MTDSPLKDPKFLTPAMAEILVSQNLIEEAGVVIDHLAANGANEATVRDLKTRLEELVKQSEWKEVARTGEDRVALVTTDGALFLEWEATLTGLELAKRKARYSGKTVARVFRAVPGPRGVRTSYQDIETAHPAGRIHLSGHPRSSVCVAAVGFLSNTGEFVPLSSTGPVEVSL